MEGVLKISQITGVPKSLKQVPFLKTAQGIIDTREGCLGKVYKNPQFLHRL